MLKRPRRARGRREREEGRGREGRGRVGGQKGDKGEGQIDVGSKKDTTGSGHYFYATGYELSVLHSLSPTTPLSGDQPLMLNQAFLYIGRSSSSSAVTVTREEDVVPSSTVTLEVEA